LKFEIHSDADLKDLHLVLSEPLWNNQNKNAKRETRNAKRETQNAELSVELINVWRTNERETLNPKR